MSACEFDPFAIDDPEVLVLSPHRQADDGLVYCEACAVVEIERLLSARRLALKDACRSYLRRGEEEPNELPVAVAEYLTCRRG